MTAVVERAEKAGKEVKPLIVPTNQAVYAVLKTAKDLKANEVILGASNKFTVDEQLEQLGFIWINLHDGSPVPLTVRILSRNRDMYLDLAGGSRIPKISERKARSVAELRGGRRRRSRAVDPRQHDCQQRPVSSSADHARSASASGAGAGAPPAATSSALTGYWKTMRNELASSTAI